MVAQEYPVRRMGIRHLRDHLNEVLREVRDDNLAVDVTLHGQVVAELRPKRDNHSPAGGLAAPTAPPDEEHLRWREEMRRLAAAPRRIDPEANRRREEALDRLTNQLSRGGAKTFSAAAQLRADRDAE